MAALLHPAREQPIARAEMFGLNPRGNRSARLLGHFELHWPAGLLLDDYDTPLHSA
jgi:hypothetical protein